MLSRSRIRNGIWTDSGTIGNTSGGLSIHSNKTQYRMGFQQSKVTRLDLDMKGSFFNSFITAAYNELKDAYAIYKN